MIPYTPIEVKARCFPERYDQVEITSFSMYRLLTNPQIANPRIAYQPGDTLTVNGITYWSEFPWYWQLASRLRWLFL